MWRFFLFGSFLVVASCGEREVAEAPKPELPEPEPVVEEKVEGAADDLLETAMIHRVVTGEEDLTGSIRVLGKKTPIGIYQRGEDWQLSWYDGPEAVRVHWRNGGLLRHQPDSNGWEKAGLSQPVADTQVIVEDLAMPWFDWNGAEFQEDQSIMGRPCRVVQVRNPGEESQFAFVRFWITRKKGYPLQAVGYNAKGGAVKRYRVVDIQRLKGENRLQRLRLESVDPDRNEVTSLAYLELDKPKRGWSFFR